MRIKSDKHNQNPNENTINRGKEIFYKNEVHYIVYEFDDNKIIISKNKDLTGAYSVKKIEVSYKKKEVVEKVVNEKAFVFHDSRKEGNNKKKV